MKDADFLKLALWYTPSSAAAGLQKSDNKGSIQVRIQIQITIETNTATRREGAAGENNTPGIIQFGN